MNKPLIHGVCTALVTPFLDGKINIKMMKHLLAAQMEAGIRSFVICGTTGEAPTLSESEKLTLFKEAKNFTGNDAVIIAGTGSNDTKKAALLSQKAQDQGADALLIVTPFYNKCTQNGLIKHYEMISSKVSVPILLYNVPSRTGVDTSPETCQELSEIPGIKGIKEASSDLRKIAEIIRSCPEDFSLFSGNDDLLLPVLSLGGKGVISVASNIKPGEMKKITDSFFKGDLVSAREEFLKLYPLMKSLFSEVNPIPVKAALKETGYDCGGCRLPLTSLSQEHLELIKKYL